MNKYLVTLEVECDPNEHHDGLLLKSPATWNWTHLLSAGGYDVFANLLAVETLEVEEAVTEDVR